MKKLILLVTALLVITGCDEEVHKSATQKKLDNDTINATDVVHNMVYLKDPRTELCFAYYFWRGPVLASVPCSSIPQSMLMVVKCERACEPAQMKLFDTQIGHCECER